MVWAGFWVKTCLIFQECPKKCPFWPLRVEVLKREIQKHEKSGLLPLCSQNTFFDVKIRD